MKKMLLVDGNSMLFRAYYATAYGTRMTTSKGIPTNAVYGFASMMQKAIDTVGPDAVMVAFDAGKHTFRHDLYPDYKGGRKETPDDLIPQFGITRDYLDGYHIRWKEVPDIEADDLIGSMARQAADYATTILTSDHDLLQLIDSTTTVMLMRKGITDLQTVTPQVLKEEMGIEPKQIIDLKGLMGDSSDNIPGIPGVGEKTALKLLASYGTVENVLDHVEELSGALRKKVEAGSDSARLSKTLATIKCDVKLDFGPEDCAFAPDYVSLVRLLDSLDMRSLSARYQAFLKENDQPAAEGIKAAEGYQRVKEVPADFLKGPCSVYLYAGRESYMLAEADGISMANGSSSLYIRMEDARKDERLLDFLRAEQPVKIGYDIKRDMHLLKRAGLAICFHDDAMIMASLADSTLTSPDKILHAYGLTTDDPIEAVRGRPGKPVEADEKKETVFACQNAENTYKLYEICLPKIHDYGMDSLYRDIEMPLTFILFRMEETGVICDDRILAGISREMKERMNAEQQAVFTTAGHEFNVNSPKQLAEVLYDELGLPAAKKRSTSADELEKLKDFHPAIEHILNYRKLQKLYGTYAEGLQKYIYDDGRIHTLYNQCVTQTGRLSSSDPNLQNISVRDEQGRVIRKAFLPSPGCLLLTSDYHQIELRMLAHMADEQGLIEAFKSGLDVHTKTAMDVFGVGQDEVTPLMRRRAKTVNFGIVYGISDFGLAQQLNISRREAADYIESYYRSYPKIRTYMESVVKDCEKNGYVTTICGRRREIPEIHDKNRMVREFGRRAAMNAPIQGSAADLIKIAMIHIEAAMAEAGVKARMILQVHDELIFDVPENEMEIMKKIVEEGMVNALKLNVPLTVECSVGKDWYEAE